MANHKSALKRVRQSEQRRIRNKIAKTRVKGAVKNVQLAVSEKLNDEALNRLNNAKSIIDKAAKKRAIHRKNAGRKISRLSKLVNTML